MSLARLETALISVVASIFWMSSVMRYKEAQPTKLTTTKHTANKTNNLRMNYRLLFLFSAFRVAITSGIISARPTHVRFLDFFFL